MYIIWLYFEVLCSLKSFSCKVEVSPSKARNAKRYTKPLMLLPAVVLDSVGPVIMNSVQPKVTA